MLRRLAYIFCILSVAFVFLHYQANYCEPQTDKSSPYCAWIIFFDNLLVQPIMDIDPEKWTAIFTFTLTLSTILLWDVTGRLLRDGKIQHAISNRAFIFISDFRYELTTASQSVEAQRILRESTPERDPALFVTRLAIQPIWRNSGNTPAIIENMQIDWGMVEDKTVGTFDREVEDVSFIGPHAEIGSNFVETAGNIQAVIAHGLHQAFPGPEPFMRIWGRIDYIDVFGKKHFTQWCYLVRPERHDGISLRISFIQTGKYNTTDTNSK